MPTGRGGGSFGAADRYAAMVAATQHRWDEAEQLFESAIALESRMRSPVFLSISRLWYGRMLLNRDTEDQRARAQELLQLAQTAAIAIGLTLVEREANQLLQSR